MGLLGPPLTGIILPPKKSCWPPGQSCDKGGGRWATVVAQTSHPPPFNYSTTNSQLHFQLTISKIFRIYFLNELEQYFFSVNYGFWSICCKIRGVQLNVSLDQPFDSIQGCNFINCVAQIQTRFWCRYIATNQMSKIG